ncbi:MAG: FCD domain-containing protein [Deltaproteobacteria bacterium]|nr:FCD domain-containing protein [Deltaproteobacteria bacterium]
MKTASQLKVADLRDFKPGDVLATWFNSDSADPPVMTETLFNSLWRHVEEKDLAGQNYLFASRKGGRPLNPSSISNLVRGWYEKAELKGLSGYRSLQKTWGLHFRKQSPNQIEVIQPVKAPSLASLIYRQLLEAIVSAKLRPGERLVTDKIAKKLGVSAIPVREALSRLREAGFISYRKGKGAVVKELSRENLEEIMEIRLTLETMAAQKATLVRASETVDRLANVLTKLIRAIRQYDVNQMIRLNKKFHLLLYRDAGKPILIKIISGLLDRIGPYFHTAYQQIDRQYLLFDIKVHQLMFEGFRDKDPEKTARYLQQDLTESVTRIVSQLDMARPSD